MKKVPNKCPSCESSLNIRRLECSSCDTAVEGAFSMPLLLKLSLEEQEFILQFIKTGGSLKEMAGLLKLSYPTVRNRLDEIIAEIKRYENDKVPDPSL